MHAMSAYHGLYKYKYCSCEDHGDTTNTPCGRQHSIRTQQYSGHCMLLCTYVLVLWAVRALFSCRLIQLPARIGDLCNLREFHVRSNCLSYLPATVLNMTPYTFTGTTCTATGGRKCCSKTCYFYDIVEANCYMLLISGELILSNT